MSRPLLPYFTAVIAAILKRKALLLLFRAMELAPLAVSENDLIATGKNLEWPFDLVHLIEVHRPGFVEVFEVRRVNEVTHLNAIPENSALRLDQHSRRHTPVLGWAR